MKIMIGEDWKKDGRWKRWYHSCLNLGTSFVSQIAYIPYIHGIKAFNDKDEM